MSRSTNNLTRMLGNQQTRPDYSARLPWYLSHEATSVSLSFTYKLYMYTPSL